MTETGTNRLIHESSPYLQQHAHNPVDWYAWGEAAFVKAAEEDKPVLLSIGYSTCHWCHVMETEVFADAEAAALINRVCVPIKVDREERPDIDQVYMKVSQMLTGVGGWPLNVFMTADKQPFYAATYIPKRSRFGRPGVMELLPKIEQAWQNNRDKIVDSAARITRALQQVNQEAATSGSIKADILDRTYQELSGKFDFRYGGFGNGQKFPMPHHLRYLLRHWQRSGEEQALAMVEQTLTAMRFGGICDQVGFGFHRYATDRSWRLPHFEKMLYDQALIAMAYVETYAATGKAFYADCAREIFTYVRRDLRSPEGLFYAAEDADSEGEEGLFYLWSAEELEQLLGGQEAAWFASQFHVTAEGNYLDEASHTRNGRNILYQSAAAGDAARLDSARCKLLTARENRPRPFRDEKILTDWNGLMIAALAMGGRLLKAAELTAAAATAARWILANMRRQDGRLLHCRYADQKAVAATLDDYAFLIWGLIELYEASMEVPFLASALELQQIMQDDFADDAGGYFLNAGDAEALLIRPKQIYDGATPSGNSVALLNSLRLARLTGDGRMEELAEAFAAAMIGEVERAPSAYSHFVAGLDFALADGLEIVIAGDAGAEDTEAMLQSLNGRFLPNAVILLHATGSSGAELASLAPYTSRLTPLDGRAAAYVCRDYSCSLPTTDIQQLQQLLQPVS